MPKDTSVLLNAIGPQQGYGQPFTGPYSNVYGTTPGSTTAQGQYYDTLSRGYENQSQELVRNAFGKAQPNFMGNQFDWSQAITFDPATGQYRLDYNKLTPEAQAAATPGWWQQQFEQVQNDPNEDRAQARQQLEGLAQKQLAQRARQEQQQAEIAGFQRELARYQSPDLMNQMVNPQMQQASNVAMATANAAGMAGGSAGQAANRRAAMQGMGQQFSQVVPQAAVAQAGQDFQWQRAREGMINNFYQQQQDRAQRDLANEQNSALFLKGFEEYEHNRSNENLSALGNIAGNAGAWVGQAAPFLKGSPNAGGK